MAPTNKQLQAQHEEEMKELKEANQKLQNQLTELLSQVTTLTQQLADKGTGAGAPAGGSARASRRFKLIGGDGDRTLRRARIFRPAILISLRKDGGKDPLSG